MAFKAGPRLSNMPSKASITSKWSKQLPRPPVCSRCLRALHTSEPAFAGHNKWSKTKHIKAVTDKKKMTDRTAFTKVIAMYSRMYGEDTRFNPQLANAISAATKASVPKTLVEAAIARGQGRSATGAKLEPMTIEILMPPNIALIADIETDNKTRTLHDLKYVVKKSGGVVGSTAFYFERRGRAVFHIKDRKPTLAEVLDEALEHDGVEDVEEIPNGSFLTWTQPTELTAITDAIANKFSFDVAESDIVWAPKEDTKVEIDSAESVEGLDALLAGLREYPEVKAMFANIRPGSGITRDDWERVERHIDI